MKVWAIEEGCDHEWRTINRDLIYKNREEALVQLVYLVNKYNEDMIKYNTGRLMLQQSKAYYKDGYNYILLLEFELI